MAEVKTTNQIIHLSEDWKNNAGKKSASFCFAEDLIDFLIMLPVLLLILRIAKSGAIAYLTSIIIPVNIILLTVNRLKSKKGFFILFLLIITAGTLILSVIFKNYLAAAASVIEAFISNTKFRNAELLHKTGIKSEHNRNVYAYRTWATVYGCALLFFIVYMISFYFKYKNLITFCFIDFAVIFAVMLIYLQNCGSYCFSRWNKITKAGGGTDVKAGGLMFALFVIIGTILIFLIDFIISDISGISRMDSNIFAFIARIFNFKIPNNTNFVAGHNPSANMKSYSMSSHVSSNYVTPNQPLFFLPEYFAYILIATAAVFIIILICLLLKSANNKLRKNTERRLLISPAKTVRNIKRKINHSINIFSHLDNRMKIRKLFLLNVKKHGSSVKSSDTPVEIGGKIKSCTGHDLKKAANYYEKAHYSINECSNTDLKNMKDALK